MSTATFFIILFCLAGLCWTAEGRCGYLQASHHSSAASRFYNFTGLQLPDGQGHPFFENHPPWSTDNTHETWTVNFCAPASCSGLLCKGYQRWIEDLPYYKEWPYAEGFYVQGGRVDLIVLCDSKMNAWEIAFQQEFTISGGLVPTIILRSGAGCSLPGNVPN